MAVEDTTAAASSKFFSFSFSHRLLIVVILALRTGTVSYDKESEKNHCSFSSHRSNPLNISCLSSSIRWIIYNFGIDKSFLVNRG